MDTKLKKSHKLTNLIIMLCILMPAFLLVSLYPRIGNVMKEKRTAFEKGMEKLEEQYVEDPNYELYTLDDNFVNYVMETSYYLYASMLTQQGVQLEMNLFEQYGWLNDYGELRENVRFKAVYDGGTELKEESNAEELGTAKTAGFLTIVFDDTGFLKETQLAGDVQVELGQANSLFQQANKSVNQFKNNVTDYEESHNIDIDENMYLPKNFEITVAIDSDCTFITESYFEYYDWYDYENQLYDTGAVFLIVVAAFMVAISAIILPFIKKLETGYEKLFCIPFELMSVLAVGAVVGAIGMYFAMAYTCGNALVHPPELELLGYEITERTWYILLLILNFLAWAIIFFAEYVVISSLRQFISRPKEYLKKRFFVVWLYGKCRKTVRGVWCKLSEIDIHNKLNRTIVKISLLSGVVILIICCVCQVVVCDWFDPYYLPTFICIAIIFSVILAIILYRIGKRMQVQYQHILEATTKMADGDLKFKVDKELGMFSPIGESLERVQQGFQKAVLEEAKSQSMKTELITNVSHDLKTPLTAIITYVDLLKNKELSEEERHAYIETLEQKSQRLKVLIEDLFEVSKAQSGNVKMNLMNVDVVSLMKQVHMEMADQIEASNLTFRFNLPERKIILLLDGQRTYRIFENLLSNALKYAMPYSRVYVDILDSEQEVKVMFRNTSAQELDYEPEQLTERFVRGDTSRKSEGSGLGLAIAKSFTELQGGKLNIEIDGDLFKVTIIWNK